MYGGGLAGCGVRGMGKALRGLGLATYVAREFGMVLPRTVTGLRDSAEPAPVSRPGVRQFGEVMLDELVLSGFSLLGGRLTATRSVDECAAAAEELGELGLDRAHADPQPLRVTSLSRKRVPRLSYQRMTFEHDPVLPETLEAAGLGGTARAVVRLCRHPDGPRPWLVWVHGAGQGGPEDLLAARIGRLHQRLGFNIAMPVQPGQGSRRSEWPTYPGADPLGNVAGMMRAVSEVRAVVRWVRPQATAVVVAGISMGSPVAALVSHLEREIDAVALYAPILGLNTMIARHLDQRGPRNGFRELFGFATAANLTSVIDPLAVDPGPPPDRRLIVGAWHDRMAMREPAMALQERWGGELYWYDGSHVGHVFSRRVHGVTERFLGEVVSENGRAAGCGTEQGVWQ